MRTTNAKVGKRDGRATYMALTFRSEFEANRVWRGMEQVSRDGNIAEGSSVVVGFCPQHGVELVLELAAGTDADAQIQAVVNYCRDNLDLTIQLREMRWQDYEPHALLVRAAKSQSN